MNLRTLVCLLKLTFSALIGHFGDLPMVPVLIDTILTIGIEFVEIIASNILTNHYTLSMAEVLEYLTETHQFSVDHSTVTVRPSGDTTVYYILKRLNIKYYLGNWHLD
jgi:hypothetical protein